MSEMCLFVLTVLLLLWLLTCVALIGVWRRRQAPPAEDPLRGTAILADLASRKHREAVEASKRLRDMADVLNIGLLEMQDGAVNAINERALRLLPTAMADPAAMIALFNSLDENGCRTLELEKSVTQVTRLAASGLGQLMLVQDVTETFVMARRLKQRERLALLGQMSAQMAHQIKTPLAVLAGQAQMLARHLEGEPSLRGRAMEIYQEARELAQRMNEIVSFYKDRKALFRHVQLGPILADVKRRLSFLAGSRMIVVQCPEDLSLSTDSGLLQNLLYLLGQNALAPEVEAKALILAARVEGDEIVVETRDDGRGIPEALRAGIFEPFAGNREDGLGLGLFLARDLAAQLGGTLFLGSGAAGTSFFLRIPRECRSENSTRDGGHG